MGFALEFLKVFSLVLFYTSPVLLLLALLIALLGCWIGRKESWLLSDAIYFAFVTATTVGYGDFHPKQRGCKFIAILIAMIGVLFTGIIVALGIHSIEAAFLKIHS